MKRLLIVLILLYGLCMVGVIFAFIVSATTGLPLKKVDIQESVEEPKETEESEKLNEINVYEIHI